MIPGSGGFPGDDAFELWCWRKLLRVTWTARSSNKSILKEINPEYSLEGLMLMLKLQYFGHLMQRANSLEKTVMLGKIAGWRRERVPTPVFWPGEFHGLYSPWDCKESDTTERLSLHFREAVEHRGAWRATVHGVTKGQT